MASVNRSTKYELPDNGPPTLRQLPQLPQPGAVGEDAKQRGTALAAFEAVRRRGLTDFDPEGLLPYRRVLVTGGTGCIGTAVLQLLQHLGIDRLTSISRRPPGRSGRLARVEYELADIRDAARLHEVFDYTRPELVIHLAGQRRPDLAERHVAETLSSNVFGTMAVLAAAGRAGVRSVVTASTGKALRYFAPEIYAASKKLAEYLVSQAPRRWGISCATVRFTHVVDNSIVYRRLRTWAKADQNIQLHAPGIGFYAQSALEAAQLLAVASSKLLPSPGVFALRDIGWPLDLTQLARDVVEDEQSSSEICFAGYEPGYEDRPFPGTFDPLRAEGSPLFNAIEAGRVLSGTSVVGAPLGVDPDPSIDDALDTLESCIENRAGDDVLRSALCEASVAALKREFALSTPQELAAICRLAVGKVGEVPEHMFVYRHLLEAAEAAGALSLTGSGAISGKKR